MTIQECKSFLGVGGCVEYGHLVFHLFKVFLSII